MKKRNIAVVFGGYSSENVVSRRSAQGIASFLDSDLYNIYLVDIEHARWTVEIEGVEPIDIDRSDFSFTYAGEKIHFDLAYITIHGNPGENGILQGYFDMVGIPYSCCGVFAAALTFNKYACNRFLSQLGFHVAKAVRIAAGEEVDPQTIAEAVGFPCFIKPNQGGSSFGTTKVKSLDEVLPAIAAARAEDDGEVLVESFLAGTEVSCGCYKTREGMTSLPITEVVSKNEFSTTRPSTPLRVSRRLLRPASPMPSPGRYRPSRPVFTMWWAVRVLSGPITSLSRGYPTCSKSIPPPA